MKWSLFRPYPSALGPSVEHGGAFDTGTSPATAVSGGATRSGLSSSDDVQVTVANGTRVTLKIQDGAGDLVGNDKSDPPNLFNLGTRAVSFSQITIQCCVPSYSAFVFTALTFPVCDLQPHCLPKTSTQPSTQGPVTMPPNHSECSVTIDRAPYRTTPSGP